MRKLTKVCLFALLWGVIKVVGQHPLPPEEEHPPPPAILEIEETPAVPTIPRGGPPAFPMTTSDTTFPATVLRYVYQVDYVTNVNAVITETRYVAVTNQVTVKAYPKTLVLRVKSRTSLTNEWEYTGHEFLMQLGTNSVEFYTADMTNVVEMYTTELSIE